MKCAHCDRPILEKFHNLRIACQLEGCISYGIKPGSKRFQMLVMGKSQEEIDAYWKLRQSKMAQTKKERGFYNDKLNNPFSIEFWIKKGFTKEESEEKIKLNSKKAVNTKRNSGYFDDLSNNPYSKKFGEKKDYHHKNQN